VPLTVSSEAPHRGQRLRFRGSHASDVFAFPNGMVLIAGTIPTYLTIPSKAFSIMCCPANPARSDSAMPDSPQ
jgi:hypothetical protein